MFFPAPAEGYAVLMVGGILLAIVTSGKIELALKWINSLFFAGMICVVGGVAILATAWA